MSYDAYYTNSVIDICGAGDNFLAGVSIMYHLTKDLSAAIEFANYCASTCLETVGVRPVTKKDVKNYVNNVLKK